MKSIRLSLMVYFLGLLAVALGAASVLAYQTAERALQAASAAKEEQIRAQFHEHCQDEEKVLDDGLRKQARDLARMVQRRMFESRRNWEKAGGYQKFAGLGVLGPSATPFNAVLFYLEAVPPPPRGKYPLSWEISQRFLPEITLDEDMADHDEKPQADYYQIDSKGLTTVRSASLGGQNLSVDPALFASEKRLFSEADDATLPSGQQVRRVVQKSPLLYSYFPVMPRPPHPHPPGRPQGSPTEMNRADPNQPSLIIQCAYDISRREAIRQKYQQRGDEEIAKLKADTKANLASVRNHLLVIGSLTFLATLGGSIWLVGVGLLPLRRLSDAVSQISPRNFQLPLPDRQLAGELKPIVQRLKDMLDMLRRAFAREKQATADISHELRTPLAVLLTTTELALRKPRTPEQYREMLGDCRLSAQQMNEIVQRLLTLARLDAGVDHLQRRPFDMVQLAEQCATLVRPLAEARGLTLAVHSGSTLSLETDPDKLREVLNNLLHNAIQYNRPSGRIDLRVLRDNNQVRLEVSDTGIGIGLEARSQIFERFYRADPSRGGDGLHAGLGLALVKEYVSLLGGRVDVESVEGQGSTFSVVLPA
jgi:two-component system, OmpR family, heavy metal sensor histidine kinase CusS